LRVQRGGEGEKEGECGTFHVGMIWWVRRP
jgi:hypothetical protein